MFYFEIDFFIWVFEKVSLNFLFHLLDRQDLLIVFTDSCRVTKWF